jgi:hypothetical protein
MAHYCHGSLSCMYKKCMYVSHLQIKEKVLLLGMMDKAGHHTVHLNTSEDVFTDFPLDVKCVDEEYTMKYLQEDHYHMT